MLGDFFFFFFLTWRGLIGWRKTLVLRQLGPNLLSLFKISVVWSSLFRGFFYKFVTHEIMLL